MSDKHAMRRFATAAAAILCGVSTPVIADTPHETILKSIADKASFERIVYETIKKVAASNPTSNPEI